MSNQVCFHVPSDAYRGVRLPATPLHIDSSNSAVDDLFLESADELEHDYCEEYMKGGTAEDQDDVDIIELDSGSDSDSDAEPTHDHPSAYSQKPSHPQWLMERFNQYVQECKERDHQKWPPIYQSGTFWFPSRSLFFILKDKTLCPQSLFPQHWFYWDPECLLPGDRRLKCTCGHFLDQKSHCTQPCHVIDFGDCFWMIGYRYQCRKCPGATLKGKKSKTFTSWHPHILQQLPSYLASEFPAYLSH